MTVTPSLGLIAQTGLTFDLSTPQGKLVANLMASLAEFEHDLLRERVRSGVAAAKARGQRFGWRPGYRPFDRHAPEVIRLSETGGTLVAVRLDLNVQSKDGGYWTATSVLAMTQG